MPLGANLTISGAPDKEKQISGAPGPNIADLPGPQAEKTHISRRGAGATIQGLQGSCRSVAIFVLEYMLMRDCDMCQHLRFWTPHGRSMNPLSTGECRVQRGPCTNTKLGGESQNGITQAMMPADRQIYGIKRGFFNNTPWEWGEKMRATPIQRALI